VVNWYLGPAAVGIYSVGVSLAELLWQLPQSAAYVLFPKAAGSSATHMNRFTPRVLAVTLGLTTLGAIGLAVLGPWLIPFFFSRRFEGSYAPMLALLPGVILLGGGKILTNDIAGRGYPEYNSITSAIVVVMTVWLTLWLIPTYGIIGASVASTIAYATAFVISLAIYRRISRRGASSAEAVVAAR
jgi:O-antigen/teichoic acid export membrane protein